MKTILFQGDSITDASRNYEQDLFKGVGYASTISGKMGLDYPNEYQFFNRGISGNRIVDLYARIKSDFINLKPDYISILIGVNDVWHEIARQNGVSGEKFIQIYRMLITELKEALPNVNIMILEPFVLNGTATAENIEEFQTEVAIRGEGARQIAKEFDLVFLSLQEHFDEACKLAPPEYWLYDGVHPTLAGHQLIASKWMEKFHKNYK